MTEQRCAECGEEFWPSGQIVGLHRTGDCRRYPCTCAPHVGPYHGKDCARRQYWDLVLNAALDRRRLLVPESSETILPTNAD